MRSLIKPLLFLLVVVMTVWIHVSAALVVPIFGTVVNIVVLALLGTALFWSWNGAALLAVIAGTLLGQYAAWTYTHIFALVGMIYGTQLVTQRWIATRSSASLVTAVSLATVMYYIFIACCMTIAHTLNYTTIGADWGSLWPIVVWQATLHPLILYFIWRKYIGGTYARTLSTQPF